MKSREPELAMVHAWLDSWSGLGAIVGMRRHGYELRLDSDENGWKASFLQPIEDILRVLGKGDEEIQKIRQRAAERAHFDNIFTRS